ncbi:Molybdopterin synthase catalytic subunit [Cladorrhinum sp. PSN332]|nr:Molybdopterin synthase catalytic subunit [Cladorrhinum sp. PSN332]
MATTQEQQPPSTVPSDTQSLTQPNIYVALTPSPLNPLTILNKVRSPSAGAIVLFAGTTRDTFDNQAVSHLSYQAYVPLALRTMLSIAAAIKEKHDLKGIAMIHRLGPVPIGEESILVAVSSPHRQAAWRAGEEALEECKDKVEVWKREEFVGGEGVWRANRDGKRGERVEEGEEPGL